MSTKKEASEYDLFRGKLKFTDEPTWLRFSLCILILAAAITLVLLIRQYALPVIGVRWLLGLKLPARMQLWKNRSP